MVEEARPSARELEAPTGLRPLVDVGRSRRDGPRAVGFKAYSLGVLLRAGLPVPEGWLLGSVCFERFVDTRLPRNHDLRRLIKMSGTRAGDERCARAYEQLLSEPMLDEVITAIDRLWEEEGDTLSNGVAVRASLVADEQMSRPIARHLHTQLGVVGPEATVEAIRRVWASAVVSSAVNAYAEVGLKQVSIAVIVQRALHPSATGVLRRDPEATGDAAGWMLGVSTLASSAMAWQRHRQLLVPLHDPTRSTPGEPEGAVGRFDPELMRTSPQGLRALCDALASVDDGALIAFGERVEQAIGPSVIHFATLGPGAEAAEPVTLLAVETPRAPVPRSRRDRTWCEITLSGSYPAPPLPLTRSIEERLTDVVVRNTVEALGSKLDADNPLVMSWAGRTYVNLVALLEAQTRLPLIRPDALLHAVGAGSNEVMGSLAGAYAGRRHNVWRMPFIGAQSAMLELRLEHDIALFERSAAREARGLSDMDLTILPNDALATTLKTAQALLERAAELWLRCVGSQLVYQQALHALLRRHVPEVSFKVGQGVATGVPGLFLPSMGLALGQVAAVFRQDPAVTQKLRVGGVRGVDDLPDGACRGALGQFLSSYGDLSLSAFELSRPRWRQDASELVQMLLVLIDAPAGETSIEARAVADHTLARFEQELGPGGRRLCRALVDRCKKVMRHRATADRWLFRSLALLRMVALDIGRRLRRIDPLIPEGGVFHCPAERLVAALRSGRPELHRTIRMRIVEREHQRHEIAPPLTFVGTSPPRGAIPLSLATPITGQGVSRGVVEGRARLLTGRLPSALDPGDILVSTVADPALCPLWSIAGGLVVESGGALGLAAEVAREYGVPAVMGVEGAALRIRDGELLRIDGDRGTVHRVERGEGAAASIRPGSLRPPAERP